MAIRKTARMGHPILRQRARDVLIHEIGGPHIERLIQDMIDTMGEYNGIGLAAPQVHESIRLAIIGFTEANPRYPGAGHFPLTVLINPRVAVLDSTEQGFWEGCLSIPEMRGFVERPRKIQVDFLDRNGQSQQVVVEDFLATVFQHELDHLDGVLYIDRVKDTRQLAFLEEYRRYWIEPEKELGD